MFIVIEGIDGAGCETQAKKLSEMLKNQSFLLKYPDYQRNVGKFIKEFLYENKNLTANEQFLLYSLQFLMDKKLIAEKRKKEIVIADRYFSTSLCYQTLAGVDLKKAINFANDFGIEKPDVIFYLDVDPDIAIQRKAGEDKEKNRNEKDFDLIRKTAKQYKMLIKEQAWAKWIKVDGNCKIDEITTKIFDIIKKILSINELTG